MTQPQYEKGELVWAKIIGFPWWPAIVISYVDKGSLNDKSDNVIVNFFGENTHAYLSEDKIRKFKENLEKFGSHIKSKKLKESINLANGYLNGKKSDTKKNVKQEKKREPPPRKETNKRKINLIKKKMVFIKKKAAESKTKPKTTPAQQIKEPKIITEKQIPVKIENVNPPTKKIKKWKKNSRKLSFPAQKRKNLKTSSTFLIPEDQKNNDKTFFKENNLSLLRTEQDWKQILHDLTSLISLKYSDDCPAMEKEKLIKSVSKNLIETLNLINEALKQECSNLNRNSLLNLLKEGYGKYIGGIMKIFETHQNYLSEIFSNFNQKFSEVNSKIKNYFFHRYLFVDAGFLKKIKEELRPEQNRKKSFELKKSKSFSFEEEDLLKDLLTESNELKDIEMEQNMKNDTNFAENDENLEIRHFRKKFCVKIARILQTQYGYEKQTSHNITIKMEEKLRREFPLMNSDYKTNGILLLNLLKVKI